MILNNTRLHTIGLAALFSLTLSACSNLPSLPTFGNDNADEQGSVEASSESSKDPNSETSGQVNTQSNSDVVDGVQVPVALTPEEIEEQVLAAKAQNLMGTLNAFKLDKETQTPLNASQKRSVQSAMNELASGNFDKALAAVQVVLDDPVFIASPNTAVWVLRGDIYRAKEDSQKAQDDYQVALTLAGSNYQAHNRLGFMYRDAGKFDLAKRHYTQAIDAWPGNATSYRNRGILFDLYMGDKNAALDDYKIYKALLDFQIQSVELPAKSLVKEQKLARQWILDIKRQILVLEREQANG